jgi:enoyl-CoA hydratase/carnithine racemase
MPKLDRDGDVYVLNLGDTENRFHPDWLAEVGLLLDEVAAAEGPRALVTTSTGKFYSNGLDLDWLQANVDQATTYIASVHALFARVLTLPVPTVAALGGHVFAAGGMFALAHDFRVMRADRGFFCLPEVDIHIPFTPGMGALIQARLHPQVAHEMMTTGRRYGGKDAAEALIVDRAVAEDVVLPTAIGIAAALAAKASPTLAAIKTGMYGPALAALADTSTLSLGS